MTAILPPDHPYEQNEKNYLDFCKCGVAKRLHKTMNKTNQPEKSVEEIAKETANLIQSDWGGDLDEYSLEALEDRLTQTLTAERQKREEAVREAYEKGHTDTLRTIPVYETNNLTQPNNK